MTDQAKRVVTTLPANSYIPLYDFDLKRHKNAQLMVSPQTLMGGAPGRLSPVYIYGASQALSGPGAISVTTFKTNFTSTGVADALTLADGLVVGQVKRIEHRVDGGNGLLTPDNFADGVNIDFTAAGTVVELIWDTDGWHILDNYNNIDGVTLATIGA